MKKTITLFLIMAIIVSIIMPAARVYAMPYFEDATITGDNVNVRLRPTTDSPSITVLQKGDRIGVFCEEVEGWYRIIYGNYRGYINKEFVFLPSENTQIGNIKETVDLRQNPGTYSSVITTLDAGTGVTIKDYAGDWYYIEVELITEDTDSTAENTDAKQTEQTAENTDAKQTADTDTEQTEEFSEEEEPQNLVLGYVHKDDIQLSTADTPRTLLKKGMSGASVRKMQQKLRKRGFLQASATGFFGDMTEAALKLFQRKADLGADGVAGPKTLEVLYSDKKISITQAELYGVRNVKLSSWSSIKNVFGRGTKALVTDVRTGRKFWVRRYGGTLHADTEPLTANDTAIIKKNYGGGVSWNRRAIWVTVGGVTYAASMNFYPHGNYRIKDNKFNGHFCIHFKGSKLHLSGTSRAGTECSKHQAAVQYAYKKGKK